MKEQDLWTLVLRDSERSPNFLKAQFPHLGDGDNNRVHF